MVYVKHSGALASGQVYVKDGGTLKPGVIYTRVGGLLVPEDGTAGPPPDLSDYPDVVLADTPEGYWRFGESSGSNAVDASGNGHHGTYNTVTLGQAGAVDGDTSAYFGGGSQSRVNTATAWGTLPTTLSVDAWVRLDPDPVNFHQTVMGLWQSSTTRLGMIARRNATGNRMAVWDNVRGWRESSVSIPLNEWHHVAWVFSGSSVTFYYDGEETNTVTTGAIGSGYTDVVIGKSQPTGSDPYKGWIDEVALYYEALDSSQIAAHYAAR